MRVKDNTPTQAARWVVQEAAKHSDRASIEERISSEKSSIVLFAKAGFDKSLPNSHKAHYKLIEVLEAKLAGLS